MSKRNSKTSKRSKEPNSPGSVGVPPVCRICLKTCSSQCMSLFEPYQKSSIAQLICSIADVKIIEGDGFPTRICKLCLVDFEIVLNFKERCRTSDDSLNKGTYHNIEIDTSNIKKEEPEYEVPILYNDTCDDNISDSYDIINDNLLLKLEEGSEELQTVSPVLTSNSEQCHECGQTFKSKCKLRVHWKREHLHKSRVCEFCKRMFKSLLAYNKHMKAIEKKPCIDLKQVVVEGEGKGRIFHCTHCDYMTLVLKTLKTHTLTHTGDKPFQCKLCPSNFSQQSSLLSHNENVHKIYRIQITCQYCGKFVQGRDRVYKHLRRHKEKNKGKSYQCDICKRFLATKTILILHLRRHSGIKSYTCELCAASFYTSSDLANHKRAKHTKDTLKIYYTCEVCGYKTHRKYHFNQHKAKHNDKNVACSQCGMFCEDEAKLKVHLKKHFGERKFACPFCESRFFNKKTVYKHISYKHNAQGKKENKDVAVKQEITLKPCPIEDNYII